MWVPWVRRLRGSAGELPGAPVPAPVGGGAGGGGGTGGAGSILAPVEDPVRASEEGEAPYEILEMWVMPSKMYTERRSREMYTRRKMYGVTEEVL